jgi:hypothetical protein
MLNLLICCSERLYIVPKFCSIKSLYSKITKLLLRYWYECVEIRFVAVGSRQRKERLYHIDDTPSGVAEVIQDLDRSHEVSETCALVSYSSGSM